MRRACTALIGMCLTIQRRFSLPADTTVNKYHLFP